MEKNEEEIEVQLFSSTDEYEINQICAILTENNIPFIRKDDGSGSYMNLYMGQSFQEKRIFVSKNDYDKSMELISMFIVKDRERENVVATEKQEEIDESSEKYILMRRGLGFLILGVPILIIIIALLLL